MPHLICPSCPCAFASAAQLAAHRVVHPAPRVPAPKREPVAKQKPAEKTKAAA